MPHHMPRRAKLAVAILGLLFAGNADAQPPRDYRNDAQFQEHLQKLAEWEFIHLSSLGETAAGRPVSLLTVGAGDVDSKPAVLVVGSVQAESLVGSHLATQIAAGLAKPPKDGARSVLEDVTFYIIPRPSPDACERVFQEPYHATGANHRPSDDDRDGDIDEDPGEDLNGDGWITLMRVKDEAGEYFPHPDEPRLLIKADPAKGERGQYRLLTEGVDNDGDERWNEDGVGGVDFNRNFTYAYPYFKPGAGPHQVSEPETRAVADFAYNHPNIFLVFSFAPQDNLNHPWKAKSGGGRIKRGVQGSDAKYLATLAKDYRRATGAKDATPAADGPGAFVPWAYHHYGRWSVAAQGWWPPKTKPAKPEKPESNAKDSTNESKDSAPAEKKPSNKKPDSRAEQGRRRLAWLDAKGVEGFVLWTVIEHPDFPGKTVEVGGFKPGVATHPPAASLSAKGLVNFLSSVAKRRARIEVLSTEAVDLG
ncbi:MAG: M14 family metallopeptidase, partial [Planctomycetota bacterium]